MFKLFFVVTLCSCIFLYYFHEYYPDKFIIVFQKIPYAATLSNQIHLYLSDSVPFIQSGLSNAKLFTPDELKLFDGEKDNKDIYLSILGEIYDVSKGRRHYGPGGPYHIFAGKDASRSFITGDFDNANPNDHVLDLSHSELLSLRDWLQFYKKEYVFKGKLIGRYFDKYGRKTKYWYELQGKFNEAEKNQKADKNEELLFPPCNVEWNGETTKVWCTNKSGGIQRNWIGVPRKVYMVGSESYRCACIDLDQLQSPNSPQYARRGHVLPYENCEPTHTTCFVND